MLYHHSTLILSPSHLSAFNPTKDTHSDVLHRKVFSYSLSSNIFCSMFSACKIFLLNLTFNDTANPDSTYRHPRKCSNTAPVFLFFQPQAAYSVFMKRASDTPLLKTAHMSSSFVHFIQNMSFYSTLPKSAMEILASPELLDLNDQL